MDINEFGKRARTTVSNGEFRGIDSARARKLGIYLGFFKEIHEPSNAQLVLTREIGLFRSREVMDPRYDRCFHAAIMFTKDGETLQFDYDLADQIVESIFLQWSILTFANQSTKRDIYHYRLLMQSDWNPNTDVLKLKPPVIPESWKPYVLYKAGRF